MNEHNVAYIRVSSYDQNTERQLEGIMNALKKGVRFGAQKKLSEEQVKEI